MADCECLAGCPFYYDRMENMPGDSEFYKGKYCKGDSAECARHQVFEAYGKGRVPVDLFPAQVERAREIIAKKKYRFEMPF